MRKQAILLTVSTAVAGLIAVGCGGSDGPPPPIAKQEFVKQANDICREEKKKSTPAFEELLAVYSQPDKQKIKEAELKYVSTSLIPRVQSELDQIRELGLPKGEEKEATEILNSIQKVADKIEKNPELYPAKVDFSAEGERAEKIGLAACPIA